MRQRFTAFRFTIRAPSEAAAPTYPACLQCLANWLKASDRVTAALPDQLPRENMRVTDPLA